MSAACVILGAFLVIVGIMIPVTWLAKAVIEKVVT